MHGEIVTQNQRAEEAVWGNGGKGKEWLYTHVIS